MKHQLDPRHATLVQAAAKGDEPPSGGSSSDPIPAGTAMPTPGGKPFEPPEGGGRDTSPPKTTTTMPLKGR